MQEAYNPSNPSRYPGPTPGTGRSGEPPSSRVRPPEAIVFDGDDTLGDGTWLHDGVREMLAALASAGYPLAILAGDGSRSLGLIEAVLPTDTFEVLYVKGDPADSTTRVRALLEVGTRLQMDGGRIAVITGSREGLASGRAAGMPIGAALWTRTDPVTCGDYLAVLREHTPEWVFETPADVSREFARWC